MPTATFKMTGLKELERKLKTLEPKAGRKVLKKAVTAATAEPRKEVRKSVPVESGALKKAIASKTKSYDRGSFILGVVGARHDRTLTYQGTLRRPAKYLHLIEGGVTPHGGHPGFAGRGMVARAFRLTQAKAQKVFVVKFGKAFEVEAAKRT